MTPCILIITNIKWSAFKFKIKIWGRVEFGIEDPMDLECVNGIVYKLKRRGWVI